MAWTFRDPSIITAVDEFQGLRILDLSVSLDGDLVAVSIPDLSTVVGAEDSGAGPARVVVLDSSNGEVVKTLEFECAWSTAQEAGFSADGKWLAVSTGSESCIEFADPDASWVSLFDLATWQEGTRLQLEGGLFEVASFTADGSRVLLHAPFTAITQLYSFPGLELLNQLEEAYPHVGPGGQAVTAPGTSRRRLLVNAETSDRVSYLETDDFITGGIVFSPDGSVLAIPTRTHDYVFASETGELLVDLGNTGTTNTMDFTADGSQLLTTNSAGAQIWDLTGRTATTGTSLIAPDAQENWINPNAVADGPELAIRVIVDDAFGDLGNAWMTLIVDPDSGATVDHIAGDSLQLPDGRFVVTQRLLGSEEQPLGPLVVLDRDSGSATELDPCVAPLEDLLAGTAIDCPGPFFSWYSSENDHLVLSSDGSFFVATSYAQPGTNRTVRVWDSSDLTVRSEFSIPYFEEAIAAGASWIATVNNSSIAAIEGPDIVPDGNFESTITVYDVGSGAVVADMAGPAPEAFPLNVNALTNDGSILFVGDFDGRSVAFDTSSWERVAEWRAHDALLRGFAISSEGTRLVTTGQDNLVKVWDISSLAAGGSLDGPPPLLDRIPAQFPTDAAWLSSDRLGVFLSDGVQYLNISLNADDLIALATQRLTRSFTVEECAVYQIEICPTLEQIRTR